MMKTDPITKICIVVAIFYNIHNVASNDAIETTSVQNLQENNPGLDTTEANAPQRPETKLTGRSGFIQTTVQKSVKPAGRFGGFPGLFGGGLGGGSLGGGGLGGGGGFGGGGLGGGGLGGGGLGGGGINTFDTTRLGTASASATNLDRTSFGNEFINPMNPYGNIYPGMGGGFIPSQGFQNQIPPYGGAYPYPPSNRYPYSMYQYPGSGGYY